MCAALQTNHHPVCLGLVWSADDKSIEIRCWSCTNLLDARPVTATERSLAINVTEDSTK